MNSKFLNVQRTRGQTLRQNINESERKLTTQDIKEIIRKSKHEPVDNEEPYADVPTAQPFSRPFQEAARSQIQDASVQYGERASAVDRPLRVIIRERVPPPPVKGEGYMRAVIGDKHYGSKGKPKSRIDILNRMLW